MPSSAIVRSSWRRARCASKAVPPTCWNRTTSRALSFLELPEMRRALLRLGAVAWATTAVVVGVAATVANADAPGQQGWWTVTNPGGLPANPAADVPSDG